MELDQTHHQLSQVGLHIGNSMTNTVSKGLGRFEFKTQLSEVTDLTTDLALNRSVIPSTTC